MSGSHIGAQRLYWPAGLEALSPAERAAALERGWWADGDAIVTRDGRRFEAPAPDEAALERYLAWIAERPL